MSTIIAGCQINEKLYESDNSLVYRALQEKKKQSVILKMLKQPYPSPGKIAWFKREYELTRYLDLTGVIKAYDLIMDHYHPVMVLEDFGGESLELLKKTNRFTLIEF